MKQLEQHYCNNCLKVTTWHIKPATRDQCQECKTKFPCKGSCRHYDCRERRGEIKACETHLTYECDKCPA